MMSCHKCKDECDDATNKDCPNYVESVVDDPCVGAMSTSADFVMLQRLPVENALDTLVEFYQNCLFGYDITLHAMQDNAEYHWIIGTDSYYTRDVTFNFGQEFVNQTIPLKLIVTRTPDSSCHPNDNGVDTLVHTVIPKHNCDASIWGHYYGAWDDAPLDSFEIAFVHEDQGPFDCFPMMIVGAKPNLPDSCAGSSCYYVDNYLTFDGVTTACYNPTGWAKLDSSLNNISIAYSISVTNTWNTPREYHIFQGHRMN